MAVLDNITVGTTQLQAVRTNILSYLYDGETDFSATITDVKETLYGEIKLLEKTNYGSYTNAELDTLLAKIKDMPKEKFLQKKLSTMAVSKIFADNNMLEESEFYDSKAKDIPLSYYIDDDSDSTVDETEESRHPRVKFGR